MVNDVYPDGRAALDATSELARQIAENPPLVVRGVKEVLDLDRALRVEAGLRYVSAWKAAFLPSEDLAEAVRALGEVPLGRVSGLNRRACPTALFAQGRGGNVASRIQSR